MHKIIIFITIIFALGVTACGNKQEAKQENIVNTSSVTDKRECGSKYLEGQYCIPFQTVVAVDERNDEDILVWGDFWVFNYNLAGDTLETVSGGSHPGLMHIKQTDTGFEVTAFDQVEDGSRYMPSAKRIFGDKYDAFQAINSDEIRREKHRAEVLAHYVKKHEIPATKYKDYGWPAKNLEE